MPFKSKAQMKAAFGGYLGKEMQSKAPQWAKETKSIKKLPQHAKQVDKKKRALNKLKRGMRGMKK